MYIINRTIPKAGSWGVKTPAAVLRLASPESSSGRAAAVVAVVAVVAVYSSRVGRQARAQATCSFDFD